MLLVPTGVTQKKGCIVGRLSIGPVHDFVGSQGVSYDRDMEIQFDHAPKHNQQPFASNEVLRDSALSHVPCYSGSEF